MIIGCPQNGLFNDLVNVILMPQMAIREMVVNVGNVGNVIYGSRMLMKTIRRLENNDC